MPRNALAVMLGFPVAASAADKLSPWVLNAEKQRYECLYTYDTKDGKTATQTV